MFQRSALAAIVAASLTRRRGGGGFADNESRPSRLPRFRRRSPGRRERVTARLGRTRWWDPARARTARPPNSIISS